MEEVKHSMSTSVKKIMVRAIKVRIEEGEIMEKILNSYQKLTATDRNELKKEFE